MTKTPAIKCYHKLQVSSHKDLEMLILPTPVLLLTRVMF